MSVTGLFESSDPIDDADLQFIGDHRLRHLLTLRGLDRQQITALLDRAETFLTRPGQAAARSEVLKGVTVANLFFEPSTRTRASFELAAKRLGADVLNLNVNTSSRKKGESILDTIYTLQAMQVTVFVVRDASAGVPGYIARNVNDYVSILNAGEADVSHPTQGLLDLMTIRHHKENFADLTVAIVGDIAHSRVARSAPRGALRI
jgi:aspartate carbamoyltransferase catalytic subunit